MICTPIRVTCADGLSALLSLFINVVLLAMITVGLALLLAACDRTPGAGPGADTRQGQASVYQQVQSVRYVSSIKPDSSANRLDLSEKAYRPTGLSGDLSVGIGMDWQVHLVNVNTGEGRRLTGGLDTKGEAVISDSYVA